MAIDFGCNENSADSGMVGYGRSAEVSEGGHVRFY